MISSLTLSVMDMSSDTSRRRTQVTLSQHHILTINTTNTTMTCSIKEVMVALKAILLEHMLMSKMRCATSSMILCQLTKHMSK